MASDPQGRDGPEKQLIELERDIERGVKPEPVAAPEPPASLLTRGSATTLSSMAVTQTRRSSARLMTTR